MKKKISAVSIKKLLVLIIFCVIAVPPAISGAGEMVEIFSDDFSTDTTTTYTWTGYGYGSPGKHSYDATNQWVSLTTADNTQYGMNKVMPVATNTGYIEFRFKPTRTFPIDGITHLSLNGTSGNSYYFRFPRLIRGNQYTSYVQKVANGTTVINKTFSSSKSSYSMNVWHTMGLEFNPTSMTAYLDGVKLITVSDPTGSTVDINKFRIAFDQQNQYVDDIKVTGVLPYVDATVDIQPDTLNLGSNGKWVTCYIEAPGYNVEDIDPSSVTLGDIISAEARPTAIGNYDEDDQNDLMVKFDRASVINYIVNNGVGDGEAIELTVTGKFNDDTKFKGSKQILVIDNN